MQRVVEEQRLGFVATVCADGTPNLSPKGTTAVWDDDHLVFANIRSPGTLANLRRNPSIEVNVVDPFVRKGYRFKGVASVLEAGALYDKAIAFYRARGSTVSTIREVVLVRVDHAQAIDSPAYDRGLTEAEVRRRWERHFRSLGVGKTPPSAVVFFYGLFMDQELLRARGAQPEGAELAWVDGFALRIGQRATLVPTPGSRVHGLVMSLALDELDVLYSEPTLRAYEPQAVLARLAGGGVVAALCYNLPQPPAAHERNPEYVAKLRALAQNVGLPADYVSSIT